MHCSIDAERKYKYGGIKMKELDAVVEKHIQLIFDTERYVWQHPETGYKEFETSAYMDG